MALTACIQFTHSSTIFILLACLFHFTKAQSCPPDQRLSYSPFKPYFSPSFSPYFPANDTLRCWNFATCFFSAISEPSKQQFAATTLVMGFIPITLRDFPWKRDNPVFISKELRRWLDILVRALGVVPKKREEGIEGTRLEPYIKNPLKHLTMATGFAAGLLIGYAGLIVMEIYSKRSSLGCVYPVFILSWWIFALIPAAIESVHESRRRHIKKKAQSTNSNTLKSNTPKKRYDNDSSEQESIGSGLVQFAWAIYGIVGALCYTSIMAVSIVELFTWVMLSVTVAGFGKNLGWLLCGLA